MVSRVTVVVALVLGCGGCAKKPNSDSLGTKPTEKKPPETAKLDAKDASDPVTMLKKIIADNETRIADASLVYLNEYEKKWAKQRIELAELKYDVKKTDSLVSPFVAIVIFKAILKQTEFFETKAQAEAATSYLTEGDLEIPCRLQYAFQDGKWGLKTRQKMMARQKTNLPLSADKSTDWSDADLSAPGCAGLLFRLIE